LLVSLLEGRYPYLFTIEGIAPAIALTWTIIFSLRLGADWSAVLGFGIGLLTDVWSDHNLGSHSMAFAIAGYAAGMLRGRFYVHSFLSAALVVGVISPIAFFSDVFYRLIFVPGFTITLWGIVSLLLRTIFNVLITLILYPLLDRPMTWMVKERT
jgi:rod shape-determining protein MreD